MKIRKIIQNTRDFNITDAATDGGTDLNETTFNGLQDNIEEAVYGIILYENEDGTNQNVTFEKELQYEPKKIKFYYKDEDGTFGFAEMYEPLGKPIDLHIIRINKNYNSRIKYSRAILTTTGITINDYGRSDNGTLSATNDIYITKIIVYK